MHSKQGRINELMTIKLNETDMLDKMWFQEWTMGDNAQVLIFRLCMEPLSLGNPICYGLPANDPKYSL